MNMFIDTHMHIGREDLLSTDIVDFMKKKGAWGELKNHISPEGVIEALDKGSIAKGVIFPLTFLPPDGNWQEMNNLTASYVQKYPDRLIGYGILNPRDVPGSLKELERCFDVLGFAGIKVHPSMQEFYPNRAEFFPIYEYCQHKKMPMLFHTGASLASHSDKFSHPVLLDDVAARFPDLTMIIAHAGRPYYQDAALLLRKHPNVYADICANLGRTGGTYLLEQVLVWLKVYADGIKRLLFASDFPVFDPAGAVADLCTIYEHGKMPYSDEPLITAEEWQSLMYRNAEKLILKENNH
jgi:hypothetical protein